MMLKAQHALPDYSLIVLCGGQGSRLGGADKGLLRTAGENFVQRLIRKLAHPQGHVVISANRHLDLYAREGHRVVPDLRAGYQGPLAGIEAALLAGIPADRPVLVVPVDMPDLPADLPAALLAQARPEQLVVVHDGQRLQPLCMMFFPGSWQVSLSTFLDAGGRSVRQWLADKPLQQVQLLRPHAFENINEPADLLIRSKQLPQNSAQYGLIGYDHPYEYQCRQ